jgi:hypothetical protein
LATRSGFGSVNWTELYREWLFDAADAPVDYLVADVARLLRKANTFSGIPDEVDEELRLEGRDIGEQLIGAAFVICQVYMTNVVAQVHGTSLQAERVSGSPLLCGGVAILKQVKELRKLVEEERKRIELGEDPKDVAAEMSGQRRKLRGQVKNAQKVCRERLLDSFGGSFGAAPAAAALNAAANYWKHRDEWGGDSWDSAPMARGPTVASIKDMGFGEGSAAINMTLAARYFGVATESHDLAPVAQAARNWAWEVAEAVSEDLMNRDLVSRPDKWTSKRVR